MNPDRSRVAHGKERDPEKLRQLSEELERILNEKAKRLHVQTDACTQLALPTCCVFELIDRTTQLQPGVWSHFGELNTVADLKKPSLNNSMIQQCTNPFGLG